MSTNEHRQPWSAGHIAQLEAMLAAEQSEEQIAAALGRTVKAVRLRTYMVRRSEPGRTEKTRKLQSRRASGASFFLS
jgi:hypothetical protein